MPVTIVIPAYGAASELRACLASLVRFAPGSAVLLADDATPDDGIAEAARAFERLLPLTYVRRTRNLGFVGNCNASIEEVLPSGNDVLLLNSDTEVTAGFLEEMWTVLHLHERHGAVSPRSNRATVFSVPPHGGLSSSDAYALWLEIRPFLPRYQVMPTAVGFCLLIKNALLRQFGAFDVDYSPGYNEENDYICRINRHGFSAVAAHHAFVFHHESSSFGASQRELERRNRCLLNKRYPEYERKLIAHTRYDADPVDHFALLWRRECRQRILFDLFHLPAKHCGTSEFGLSLLLHLAPRLEERYDVHVGLSDEARRFFAHELTGYHFFDRRRVDERFDLVFKPAQIFTWHELYWMTRFGGRVAYTHLDIIAVRCDYLGGPNTKALFRVAASVADRVYTISEFSRSDFIAFYGDDAPFEVIRPGTHESPGSGSSRRRHVLIIGNAFHHKAVRRAVEALAGLPVEIVALGGGDEPAIDGVQWRASGSLTRSQMADLYDRSAVLVYPSFYEGFGMPIVDALTRGIPVVALDTEVNRELRSLTGNDRLALVRDHVELGSAVSEFLQHPWQEDGLSTPVRTWQVVADEYARSFDDLLARDLDIGRIRRRWDLLTTIDAVNPIA